MRAPFQVLVLPYQMTDNVPRFLIALRSDNGVWQAISGGGEDSESLVEAAKRELAEETKLVGSNWQQLDSMCMLPKVFYSGHENWAGHQYVIPEYSFSVQVTSEPQLSNEHTEYRWCSYQEANKLLKYDSNRIALWETHERLRSTS
ncbi:NUDIX pyrophosphatase [Photobacterium ganghwense]|uniref:DNA mismatch repair protein MutT n=1 Tax=Photobacterium ganghwense TaxID=320778 RepID=A0A0J1HDU6_9GAMM|nr:NUDIX pyrophosphatase [Photobacterium ganghwense]KLV09793.1 DNA mismatch repair protein MutT [Photobacterium ganghwense]PSU09366.1 NUDIX pyrophosphatase [Photobacterium ganghwense]QSV16556.1 NUDIX pyrophosphatase [Photobacterium ganghwense]